MLTQRQKQLNAQINDFLHFSYALEMEFAKKHDNSMASKIRRYSSELADAIILVSGIRESLHEFWQDKKELIGRECEA